MRQHGMPEKMAHLGVAPGGGICSMHNADVCVFSSLLAACSSSQLLCDMTNIFSAPHV